MASSHPIGKALFGSERLQLGGVPLRVAMRKKLYGERGMPHTSNSIIVKQTIKLMHFFLTRPFFP